MACGGAQVRDPRDLVPILQAVVGPADHDVGFTYTLAPPRATGLADFRVAVWSEDPACPIDDDVAEAVAEAIGTAGSGGQGRDAAYEPSLSTGFYVVRCPSRAGCRCPRGEGPGGVRQEGQLGSRRGFRSRRARGPRSSGRRSRRVAESRRSWRGRPWSEGHRRRWRASWETVMPLVAARSPSLPTAWTFFSTLPGCQRGSTLRMSATSRSPAGVAVPVMKPRPRDE
jgi:hypothetical protein